MYLFVGLGNPGREYEYTRHNIGFRVLDSFAARYGCCFKPGKGTYWFGQCSLKNTNVYLLKPFTFMNASGSAVKEFLSLHPVDFDRIVIIYDDIHLPLGTLRFRLRGSDGGHKGLASIIYSLETDALPRLRVGITPLQREASPEQLADFVLSSFEQSEEPIVTQILDKASDALSAFVEKGSTFVMNTFNKSFFN